MKLEEEEVSISYDAAAVVTPLCKARLQDLDARFTLVGLVERSSPPMETSSSTLYNTLVTLSNGLDYVVVCMSLPQWESHPKCLRRGDILVCRNCRRQRDGVVLKLPAGHWVLVNGEETAALPRCLSEQEVAVVLELRSLVATGALGFTFCTTFLPQAYLPCRRRVSKLARAVEVPFYFHLEQLFFATLQEKQAFASLDAVQVTILWPFHESFWGAVIWDGYGYGFWAAALNCDVVAILHDAVWFCDGWVRVKKSRLQSRTDGHPELLLCDIAAISPKNEDVLFRLEHKAAFGPFDVASPAPSVLKGWYNYVWLCNVCLSTSYWPKAFCFCCGKRFDVQRDTLLEGRRSKG